MRPTAKALEPIQEEDEFEASMLDVAQSTLHKIQDENLGNNGPGECAIKSTVLSKNSI